MIVVDCNSIRQFICLYTCRRTIVTVGFGLLDLFC